MSVLRFFTATLCAFMLMDCDVMAARLTAPAQHPVQSAYVAPEQNTSASEKNAPASEEAQPKEESPKIDINQLLAGVRSQCNGIAEDLRETKKLATVNTVVTGTGTVAGGVAVYAGLSKKSLDAQVEELEKQLRNIANMTDKEFVKFIKNMVDYQERLEEFNSICAEKKNLEEKSKKMGNLRTGMMAANTATAIAGTVIASKNENDGRSIAERIIACKNAVNALHAPMQQSRIDGDMETFNRLQYVVQECDKMYPNNLEKIYKNSSVAKVSSAINIGTGVIGTATSAAANSSAVRNDNTEAGKKKEKNLNTTANIFAGASTVASGVSTVFNAKTIKAVKDNLGYAEKCEEALK